MWTLMYIWILYVGEYFNLGLILEKLGLGIEIEFKNLILGIYIWNKNRKRKIWQRKLWEKVLGFPYSRGENYKGKLVEKFEVFSHLREKKIKEN